MPDREHGFTIGHGGSVFGRLLLLQKGCFLQQYGA